MPLKLRGLARRPDPVDVMVEVQIAMARAINRALATAIDQIEAQDQATAR